MDLSFRSNGKPIPPHCPQCGSTEQNHASENCKLSAHTWHAGLPDLNLAVEIPAVTLIADGVMPEPEPDRTVRSYYAGFAYKHVMAQNAHNEACGTGEMVVGYNAWRCKEDHLGYPCDLVSPRPYPCEHGHIPPLWAQTRGG